MMTDADPSVWGVAPGHHHVDGSWVPAPARGVDAAMAAMHAAGSPADTATWVIQARDGLDLPTPATLVTEDGATERVRSRMAPDALPLGYHWLEFEDGGPRIRLIVSPGSCPLPSRRWGWAVQLYATRSRTSWGHGDLADLRRLSAWSGNELGAGMLLVNPLHAVAPTPGQQASPYYPASRRWRSPLYLRIEEVPGAAAIGAPLEELAAEGRALNAGARINRTEVWRLKRAALEMIWEATRPGGGSFASWAEEQGEALAGFATWAALADRHGPDWRVWPAELRRSASPAVAAFRAAHGDAVAFHSWLQWLIEIQLSAAAAQGPALVTDLAIGADPAGADAWQWQDVLASGVTVGAPPDEFSPAGQDWGLPPFDPWRLRAHGYEPFVDILRTAMAGGGGVRIDHVAGLFRLFWVPAGAGAADGVYVRYPWRDLLNVVALEAHRAGAFAVGEDLGTVEPEARQALADSNILSYRLLWFEDQPTSQWPEKALAAVTTHDLPTVPGVWTGADLEARRAIGLRVDEAAELRLQDRLRQVVGANPDDSAPLAVAEVVRRAHESLSATPSLLVTATLEDALGVYERPNQPGTVDEWPNWSIPLPVPVEEIESDSHVRSVAAAIGQGRGYKG